jgi:hypothetical protein
MVVSRSRRLAALLVVAVLAASGAVLACGGPAPDPNEPNDEPGAATTLAPGEAVEGVIGGDQDADVFVCAAPGASESGAAEDAVGGAAGDRADGAADGAEPRPFVVTVVSEAPDDLEVDVGASVPGAPEGISWPGWDAVQGDGRVTVEGGLGQGATLVVVLTGEAGTAYSLRLDWE